MKLIIRFLTSSNIWVSFCALALTASSEILFQTTNHSISQFVFFATFFTYNFQRVVRIKKNKIRPSEIWLKQNRRTIFPLMFLALIVSFYHFINFKLATQIAIIFSATLSFLYPFGIRNIPFLKIFVISLVWAISTMLLILLENNLLISQNIIWHFISRFLFVFAITIPFDIRDLKHDSGEIKTIPILFGFEKAKLIAIFSLFFCSVIVIFQQFQHQIKLSDFLALMLLYFLASLLIQKSNLNQNEMFFSFWVESLSVFGYLFLLILLLIFQTRLFTFTAL